MTLTSKGSEINLGPGTLPQRRANEETRPSELASVWIRKRHRTCAQLALEASHHSHHPVVPLTGCDPHQHPVVTPGPSLSPAAAFMVPPKLPGWTRSNLLDCTVVQPPRSNTSLPFFCCVVSMRLPTG